MRREANAGVVGLGDRGEPRKREGAASPACSARVMSHSSRATLDRYGNDAAGVKAARSPENPPVVVEPRAARRMLVHESMRRAVEKRAANQPVDDGYASRNALVSVPTNVLR